MKNVLVLSLSSLLMVGCAAETNYVDREVQVPGPTVSVAVPVPGPVITVLPAPLTVIQEVQALVAEENDYRMKVGQTSLTQGLVCTLYTVPQNTGGIAGNSLTQKSSWVYQGTFNQQEAPAPQGLNILPPALRTQYTSWYVVKCRGQLVVTQTDYYQLDLVSDDGSLLYLDGSKLIDNDGNHAPKLASGSKLLRKGVHSFELQYMQGPSGSEALILSSSGALVPAEHFFH